jgi:hypothetical protein
MDRLARNLDDLRRIVQTLTRRGIQIKFLKEHLTFTGEDSPMAKLLLSVMGAFPEFERALTRERQAEGIALAKARGALPRARSCTGRYVIGLGSSLMVLRSGAALEARQSTAPQYDGGLRVEGGRGWGVAGIPARPASGSGKLDEGEIFTVCTQSPETRSVRESA